MPYLSALSFVLFTSVPVASAHNTMFPDRVSTLSPLSSGGDEVFEKNEPSAATIDHPSTVRTEPVGFVQKTGTTPARGWGVGIQPGDIEKFAKGAKVVVYSGEDVQKERIVGDGEIDMMSEGPSVFVYGLWIGTGGKKQNREVSKTCIRLKTDQIVPNFQTTSSEQNPTTPAVEVRSDDRQSDNKVEKVLRRLLMPRTVAMVGASTRPERVSNQVMSWLQSRGVRVIPVNPRAKEILGEPCVASLAELPADVTIDMIDVFRNSAAAEGIANEVIELRKKQKEQGGRGPLTADHLCLWNQKTITIKDETARRVEAAGVTVVMNKCPKAESKRLGI